MVTLLNSLQSLQPRDASHRSLPLRKSWRSIMCLTTANTFRSALLGTSVGMYLENYFHVGMMPKYNFLSSCPSWFFSSSIYFHRSTMISLRRYGLYKITSICSSDTLRPPIASLHKALCQLANHRFNSSKYSSWLFHCAWWAEHPPPGFVGFSRWNQTTSILDPPSIAFWRQLPMIERSLTVRTFARSITSTIC